MAYRTFGVNQAVKELRKGKEVFHANGGTSWKLRKVRNKRRQEVWFNYPSYNWRKDSDSIAQWIKGQRDIEFQLSSN